MTFESTVLEFLWEMVFGVVSGNYLYLMLSECYKNTVIYLSYSCTRFLCIEQRLVIEPSLIIPLAGPLRKLSRDMETKL